MWTTYSLRGALAVAAFFGAMTVPASAAFASTHAVTTKSSTVRTRDWSVTIRLTRTTVKAGTPIPAVVIIENRTHRTLAGRGCADGLYKMALENARVRQTMAQPSSCNWSISPGRHLFRTRVLTRYIICGSPGFPSCQGRTEVPTPLPAGAYRTEVVLPIAPGLRTPRPIRVLLTG